MDLNSGAPFVRHFLIRRPFPRARRALWGGLTARSYNPAHFTFHLYTVPRVKELTRGLRLPAYSACTPPPDVALISGKPSPPFIRPAFRKSI